MDNMEQIIEDKSNKAEPGGVELQAQIQKENADWGWQQECHSDADKEFPHLCPSGVGACFEES